ncbi:MAG: hypothetical protein A2Z20_12155 [Bdellovibrionales bacterium RBG_16_40_8]|nr:MAG: hypothetical protein A2Z20_12155 [Bdellovibrionales bacterium RBG_16_40_8]
MKTQTFIKGDNRYKVRALRVGTNLWLHINGETWVIDQKPKVEKKSNKKLETTKATKADIGDAGLSEIAAPMPGKILKVNVKQGDIVEAQQILIVMEAMKMEYSLTANSAGTIKMLTCKEGDQVELHQILVKVAY